METPHNSENEQEQKKVRGRPKTVNGQYDSKKYYQAFKEKNGDKIKEKVQCTICNGYYSYFNRSHHNSSIKHSKALQNQTKKEEDENIQVDFTEKKLKNIIIVD